MLDIETMLTELIDREGREFTNHPEDRGGPTKFGITLKTLSAWRQRPCTADDVANMQEDEARMIFRHRYLIEPRFHVIHDPYVLVLIFDSGVNHGTHRAARWLQQAVGVPDDGIIGPVSEAAINTTDPVRTYYRVLARRVRFYGAITTDDNERKRATRDGYALQARFTKGWLNRAAEFIEAIG